MIPRERRPRAAAILFALLAALGFVWLSWSLPLSRSLAPLPDPALVFISAEGQAFARRGSYKEAPVDASRLPPHVTGALLAIEDRRFYRHPGVDLRGIARAALANARAGGVVEGGSTLTQQLAKTSFLQNERSLRRKLQEVLIAFWLELRLSKNEILSRYLSSVYFGDGVYGLRAAARHYFDKPPEALDVSEAAMLAGLVKAPSRLAPTQNLPGAQRRGEVVLAAMVDAGLLSPAERRRARPARPRPGRRSLPTGSYFADWLSPAAKAAVPAAYGEVRVQTTLEAGLQRRAEQVVSRALARNGARLGVEQAALVAMRPDGRVVAMVGGRDYRDSVFNRAVQARRQPGSAFKLFVYLAALRRGAAPDSLVEDAPLTLGDWSPGNFDGRYAGAITLRDAFARSSNVAAVRVSEEVGRRAVIRTARDLGVAGELPAHPSLALGAAETTLLELTAAYAAVAGGAYPIQPRGMPLREGEERSRWLSSLEPLDPDGQRAPMLSMLRAVVEAGTGRAAALPVAAYGKTGTTQDHRDALFVGFAGDLVVGVWVGNDNQGSMRGVTGGGLPAEIWRDFMAAAMTRPEHRAAFAQGPPAPLLAPRPGLLSRLFGRGERAGTAPLDERPTASAPAGDERSTAPAPALVPVPLPLPLPGPELAPRAAPENGLARELDDDEGERRGRGRGRDDRPRGDRDDDDDDDDDEDGDDDDEEEDDDDDGD